MRKPLGLEIDATAKPSRKGEPAFASPPEGAPAYYGLPVLEDVEVDGWRLGEITGFEDADERRCVCHRARWIPRRSHLGTDGSLLRRRPLAPWGSGWGVYRVGFVHPFVMSEAYRQNLRDIVPRLRDEWQRSLSG